MTYFFGPLRGDKRPTGWRPRLRAHRSYRGREGVNPGNPASRMLLAKVIGSLLEEMPKAANGGVPADLMSFFLHGRRDKPGVERSKSAAPLADGNPN